MVSDRNHKRSPPYVSFRTFENIIKDMSMDGVPSRIDPSYKHVATISGSNRTQLLAALRFLGLTEGNVPTPRLQALVAADASNRNRMLKDFGTEAYSYVLTALPPNATPAQLVEAFNSNYALTGDVLRKCMKFFLDFAALSGMQIPNSIRDAKFPSASAKSAKNAKTVVPRTKQNSIVPTPVRATVVSSSSWCHECLRSVFPVLDLDWPPEQKAKWFVAFAELVRLNPNITPQRD
jgi:hypothetical protein